MTEHKISPEEAEINRGLVWQIMRVFILIHFN